MGRIKKLKVYNIGVVIKKKLTQKYPMYENKLQSGCCCVSFCKNSYNEVYLGVPFCDVHSRVISNTRNEIIKKFRKW